MVRSWSGSNNPNWRGGITFDKDGYIYQPNHPHTNHNGCVFEHRLVMEKKLGRYLTKEESVHHVDSNNQNNCIDNLILFETEGKHRAYHAQFRQRDNLGRWAKGV